MRTSRKRSGREILDAALELRKSGVPDHLIEIPEAAAFPHLINVEPSTARKSRVTGRLQGRAAPKHVRRGRSVVYKLSDIFDWLGEEPTDV